jgi:predicted nucleotidyltransferase
MINNDYISTVKSIKEYLIGRNIVIDKFYLFGSRARNENNPDSDYDFMIVVNNDLRNSEKRTIIADIYRHLMLKKELIVMDLIIKTAGKFYSESQGRGYLSNTVLKEGIEV